MNDINTDSAVSRSTARAWKIKEAASWAGMEFEIFELDQRFNLEDNLDWMVKLLEFLCKAKYKKDKEEHNKT